MNHYKKFGPISIVLFGINTIIGSGVFLLPHQTYAMIGNLSIIVLIIDALVALGIALSFAENASRFNQDGGPYLYATQAFGDFVGFEVGFIKWVVTMIALASQVNAFALTFSKTFPIVNEAILQKTTIITLFLLLMGIQFIGPQGTKWSSNIATVAKLIPLIIIIGVGIWYINPHQFVSTTNLSPYATTLGQASVMMFYGFSGFESLVVVAEKMKDPNKNMPRALLWTMLVVPMIYILLQIIAIGVLGSDLKTTTLPFQTVMERLIGPFGGLLVSFGTLLSIFGITISLSFVGATSAEVLAQDGLLPSIFSKKKNDVPVWNIMITLGIALIIALSGSFTTLATMSVIARFAQYIPTVLAVLVLRKTKGKAPFTIWGGRLIPIMSLMAMGWFMIQTSWQDLVGGMIGLIIGIPIYMVQKKRLINKQPC